MVAVQFDRLDRAVDERPPGFQLLGQRWRIADAREEEHGAMHTAGLVSGHHGEVVLDDPLQRVHAPVRPLIEAQTRPAAHQFEHPRPGIWIGRSDRGHVPELREDYVVEPPRLRAARDRVEVGQARVQDDEQPDLLAPALEFLRDREGDVPAQ